METKFTIPNYILASKTKRLLNFIIDLLIMKLTIWTLIITAELIFSKNELGIINRVDSFDKMETYLFWSITSFIFYTITETILSRSLAKYFTQTIVVLEDGTKPTPIDILARSAIRLIPFEYFTFLRGRKPGWHDELSKTFVVNIEKLENTKKEFLMLQDL